MAQVIKLYVCSLMLTLCSLNLAANELFHIASTSTSAELCNDPCLTLSELAANVSHYPHANLTVIFLPGIHYLTVSMSISNTDAFSMSSESTTAHIMCRKSSRIHFNNSQYISISNLEFIACGGNQVRNVAEFVVEDTKFHGQNNILLGGTALEITGTATQIINSTFKFNTVGEHKNLMVSSGVRFVLPKNGFAGGAIVATSCRIAISRSRFENNGAEYGGAIYAQQSSMIIIRSSSFTTSSALFGGVLFSLRSTIIIERSEFHVNKAKDAGGVLYSFDSFINIKASKFNYNTAKSGSSLQGGGGGVLYSFKSTVVIERGQFNGNTAVSESSFIQGGGGVVFSLECTITIRASEFEGNRATSSFKDVGGGVLYSSKSTITISEMSKFDGNSATNRQQGTCTGGVLHCDHSHVTIKASKFSRNTAVSGGVVHFNNCTVTILASRFDNNSVTLRLHGFGTGFPRGGVMYSKSSIITIGSANQCNGNTALFDGGVLFSQNSTITIVSESTAIANLRGSHNDTNNKSANDIGADTSASLQLVNNTAEFAVIYLSNSELNVNYSGKLTLSHNVGSLVAFSSNITFMGCVVFINNHPQKPNSTSGTLQEGGALTLFQSNAYFNGKCTFLNNYAKDGGGLLSAESRIYVNGEVIMTHNTAFRNGGGAYLSNSELTCLQKSTVLLEQNIAGCKGGGIHAVSSTVKATSAYLQNTNVNRYTGTRLNITMNVADMGGGVSLEANSKLYILKYNLVESTNAYLVNTTVFTANSAHSYGGAMYVDDHTDSGGCTSSSKTECFLQVLAVHGQRSGYLSMQSIYFSQNQADISGSTLYGGLLDRCALSQFAEILYKPGEDLKTDGISYFKYVSTPMYIERDMDDVDKEVSIATNFSMSSGPVKVCLCMKNEHNCSHQAHIEVKKGETFNVSLIAVNQIEQPVAATISASLLFPQSGLSEGQLTSEILGECTDLTFNVVSRHKYENLTLYALDGPCKDADLSRRVITIDFQPCSCPIGFQISGKFEINCTCDCHNNVSQYIEHCDSQTGTFVKKSQSRAWISYIDSTHIAGYLIYPNCPYDYCYTNSFSPPIDLNLSDGADAQCAFNRSSLLCGSCQPGLTLSLGSSLCLQCPSYWPVYLIAITLAAILAGVALVALLLLLNMTVSVGSLNGLIFYANIVYVNKSILLPYQETSFVTVIVSWLNLELGINTCYFPGIDGYVKTWLRWIFPIYIIVLVALVIIVSSYSLKFSKLIGKRDPAATLATLILLSYAKFLEICFESLSVGILEYPDGTQELLWLPDATVNYLSGKHIPLFIVAVIILLIGVVYTTILFSWQWLLCLPDRKVFKWTRNQKLHAFIETHHVPFTPKHRYWAGLLLIARAILYLVAAVNVSNDPQLALSAIVLSVSCILILRSFLQSKVYRKLPVNILETFFFFNLLFFAIFTWYSLSNTSINQKAVAYVSILSTFFVMLLIIFCHVYTYTQIFINVKKTRPFRRICTFLTRNNQALSRPKSLPPDDDIHRFTELLDIIDRPVNTNDYRVPLLSAEPTQTVVEVHHPYLPPSEPEKATSQNTAASNSNQE